MKSQPGFGSTFWFTVPFEKQLKEAVAENFLLAAAFDVKDLRILGVDDNATNRMILTKMVENFGCQIDTVESGTKALEILRNAYRNGNPYRIVLLDMQMPGMGGEQTAREIKGDPAVRETQIIILTSIGQRGDVVRLESLGCAAYLLKPVRQQILYEALRTVLAQKQVQQPRMITRHLIVEQKRQGQRILLAEDNPINQKLAVIILQKAGFSVDAVETGLHALEKVQTQSYNAVLMDVQMPEMDGFEATKRIRQWEGNDRHVPIIAMTAHALKGDRERCLQAGMDDYVTKPIKPQALFTILDRWTQTDLSSVMRNATEAQTRFDETGPMDELEVPLDIEGALPRFYNDRNFFIEMCRDLLAHMPERINTMKIALNSNDGNTLFRMGHNLKGVAANFNAGPLIRAAEQIEVLGQREDITDARVLVEKIEFESERLRLYCAEQLGIR